YDLPVGKLVRRITQPGARFNPLVYSPDGRWLAADCGAKEDAIRIWDALAGTERLRFHGSDRSHNPLCFSADGKLVAAVGRVPSEVRMWDVATGKEIRRFRNDVDLGLVQFSGDGKTLLAEARDGAVVAWEVASGRTSAIGADPGTAIHGLRFASNGQ